ncbi:MAG: ABC transporter ATP-binding protein [Actinobacteria bacterium]|nr:ABC transporter ATP-binding protein [Actinomycetota bacterium]
MEPVVRVADLTKRWGSTLALDSVTVDVPGGVTGLLGANGAGKTTLLGLVLGFHRPDAGAIEVFGHDPSTFGPDVRMRIGYAPEHEAMPTDVQAQDLVRHIAELHGIPRRAAVTRASDALFLVGLGEERFRPIGTMSTGQKQRVKVAQAIAHDPALILLDEPTNGLDPLQREEMLALIRRIGHDLGIHVVVSSHLIHEVERICDGVVVLDAGRLAAAGPVEGLKTVSDRLLIEVDGVADSVRAQLERAGLTVEAVGVAQFVVAVHDDAVLDTIRDALIEAGVGLRRLEPRTRSLEDLFFAVPDEERA